MKIRKIDHICFAVRNLEKTKAIYRESLSMTPDLEYVAESEHIKVARYYVGEVAIEFMEPTSAESDVARSIERRGEGAFLISYRVDDLDAAMDELKKKGARLIDEKPRTLFGNRYAFIQKPDELAGVLVELLDGEFDASQVG
ncbi:MAG: VOC family protein [Syntrophorhabdales bacterium]